MPKSSSTNNLLILFEIHLQKWVHIEAPKFDNFLNLGNLLKMILGERNPQIFLKKLKSSNKKNNFMFLFETLLQKWPWIGAANY